MAFGALHGLTLSYLDQLVRVADLSDHRHLRSSTSQLGPTHRLATVGRRSFPVATPVTTVTAVCKSSHRTQYVFRRRLKTH